MNWWKQWRRWTLQHRLHKTLDPYRDKMQTIYREFQQIRPYPTPEEWAQFRAEMSQALEMAQDPQATVWFPILGTQYYHWAGFGSEITEIVEANCTDTHLSLVLSDGRAVRIPLDSVPILRDAWPEERAEVVIEHAGHVGHEQVQFPRLNTEVLLAQAMAVHLSPHDAAGLVRTISDYDPVHIIAEIIVGRTGPDHHAQKHLLEEVQRALQQSQV